MTLIIGTIAIIITNVFNMMEVQELAENRDNYNKFQAFFVAMLFGLILSVIIGVFQEIHIQFEWLILVHAVVWTVQVLASFTLATRLHPVTYRISYGLLLPTIIIMDTILGNLEINILTIMGFVVILSSVLTRMFREKESNELQKMNKSTVWLTAVWVIGNSLVKVLKYQIRTGYDISAVDFMLTNAVIGLPLYFALLLILKEFKPKSIVENGMSHTRAGFYSGAQQILGLYVAGFITATVMELIKSVTSYLVVPLSGRSKDKIISKTSNKSYIYFVANTLGTILILLS